jgi:hypothetical protein
MKTLTTRSRRYSRYAKCFEKEFDFFQQKPDFICDNCNNEITNDHIYHCLTCVNYDLCETCIASGVHQSHAMLRIGSPMDINWTVCAIIIFPVESTGSNVQLLGAA